MRENRQKMASCFCTAVKPPVWVWYERKKEEIPMKQVKTGKGIVEGIQKEGYSLFLGIPYAKAPVGELRWRAPQEHEGWEGVYHADHYPNRSMQEAHPMPFFDKEFYDDPERKTPYSEDSLYLNIWTPAEDAGEKLPVAMWIHGGAFLGGCGHEKEFGGEAFCKQGVILVTINYRLGPLGFLAHPWLTGENRAMGGPGVSGNYGSLDQIAALKWVREHIEAFGGDPENITVFGQSAGGESTHTLTTSPLTRGMISKAIIQSGLGLTRDRTLADAERDGLEFAENAGVQSLEEMRDLTVEQIFAAAGPLIGRGFAMDSMTFAPNIDGWLLEQGFDEALEQGNVHDIPYMVGSTKQDIRVDLEKLAEGELGVVYECCKHWGEERQKSGSKPAWVYYFTRQLPGDDAGAFHSSELWYMFGTLNRCWRPSTEGDFALSDHMVTYWANFMKTGDPNGDGLPQWKPYADEQDIQILDV